MTERRLLTGPLGNRASLAAALVCAVLIGVLAWPSQMDAPLPAPPPPRVRQITTAKDDSGDDGRARTVEHGFTALEDAAREHLVSWGVILENTSHRMTARLMVTVTILDRAGKPVLTEQLDADIEPGKRFGLGDTAYVKRPGARTMKIELSRPEWWPTTSAVPPLAPVTASQVKGRLRKYDDDQFYLVSGPKGPRAEVHRERRLDLDLTFRVDSGHRTTLDNPWAIAILRDRSGRILGATKRIDSDPQAKYPPGWSFQKIRARGVPAATAVERTEVYPQSVR
ncbi:hypothetical protein [Actinomadura xylanilytica]|uniref:hypothetical protein n=1 Tax=Actinomadura xylanilytica TaxID=887459 RepID=UPI00255A78A3|nr:hypothetical protein [Actinomadura xylanilytica]MDL4772936.1 hypothetical protein [Actinomadura xylanilytica]